MLLAYRRVLAVATAAALVTAVSCGRQLQRLTAVDQSLEADSPAFRLPDSSFGGPSVQITVPLASPLINSLLKPGQNVRWEGVDPDGPRPTPVAYKFRFFFESDTPFPIDLIRTNPDSLRRFYAPDYEGWETAAAHQTSAAVPDGPQEQGAFVVVAVDAGGATTAPFTLNTNVLMLRRAHPDAVIGPLLTVYNAALNVTTPTAVPPAMPPTFEVTIPVAAGAPVTLNWFGTPPLGLGIDGYRWGMDLDNVVDDGSQGGGPGHWSQWNLQTTSVTVGPFRGPAAGQDHVVYIEARDNVGNITLVAIRLHTVEAPRDRPLLIVDDTRLNPDRLTSQSWGRPLGRWPTAAELDTFLYARGGVDWNYAYDHHPVAVERGVTGPYPPGTQTMPGLFAGYDYDTIGTRFGRADLTVPLEVLLNYRHVVWIVDGAGAANSRPGTDPTQPMTSLRYMTGSGRTNTLAQYVALGGKLWLVGGGGGMAACIANNDPANDFPTTTFRRDGRPQFNELGPGRFMWDLAHWRSAFRVSIAPVSTIARTTPPPGQGVPSYARMPASFDTKTPATDPLPPLRIAPDFYRVNLDLEFLIDPNGILEPRGGQGRDSVSVLDTLYRANAMSVGVAAPVVTYYRGSDNAPLLFSGIDLWNYRREQCQQMVDAVLQDLWHLSPSAAPEPMRRARPSLRAVAPAPAGARTHAVKGTAAERYRTRR